MNLFNYTVVFTKSTDYLRLMGVLYLLAELMLLNCGLSLIVKLLGSVVLLVQGLMIWKNPTPQPHHVTLEYLNKKWFLRHQDGYTQIFTQHRVLIEAGLFFMLHLSSEDTRKNVVIFFDQISPDDYRALRILEKINR